jgi:hypothetical protein
LINQREQGGTAVINGWNNQIRLTTGTGFSSNLNYISGAGAEIFTYGSSIVNSGWVYIAFTCDIQAQTKPTYINGELAITNPTNAGDWAQGASGIATTCTLQTINADIGVFKIYNRALTQTEIRQNSNFFRRRTTGIATQAVDYVKDGLVMYLDAANQDSLTIFNTYRNGIAATNQGIICQPFQVYDYPFNQIRQLGIFTTESGNNVSFMLYDEEI